VGWGIEGCCKSSVAVNDVARYGVGVGGVVRFYVAVKGVNGEFVILGLAMDGLIRNCVIRKSFSWKVWLGMVLMGMVKI